MSESIRCPNCNGPQQVDSQEPTLTCTYCGHQSPNPLLRSTQTAAKPQAASRLILLVLIGSVVSLLIVVGVIVAVSSSSSNITISSTTTSSTTTSTSAAEHMAKIQREVQQHLGTSLKRVKGSIQDRITKTVRRARASGAASAVVDHEPEADRILGEKLAAYDQCLGRHAERVHASKRRYLSWVADADKGPTCKERYISYGVYAIYDPKRCADAVAQVRSTEPRIPALERAGDQLVQTLRELEPLLSRIERYYDQKDYLDDACAKGKESHPKMMQLWRTFEVAHKSLADALERPQASLLRRRVALARGSYGKGLRLGFLEVVAAANELIHAGSSETSATEPEISAVTDAVARLVQSTDALMELSEQRSKEAKHVLWFGSFSRQAGELRAAAKSFVRRLTKGKRLSRTDQRRIASGAGWMVDGSWAKVVALHRKLVDSANNVRFR